MIVSCDNAWTAAGVGHVYAFEQASGALRWKHREQVGIPTAVVRAGDAVFATTLSDELIALDLRSGRLLWRFASGATNDEFEHNPSPAAHGTHVYFGTLAGDVYALAAASGQVIWKSPLAARVSTDLVVDDHDLYVGTTADRLYRLDAENGRVTGEVKLPAAPRGTPALTRDAILLFGGRDLLLCLDRALTQVRWRRAAQEHWTTHLPLVYGDTVVVAEETGQVRAYSITAGQPRWQRSLEGNIRTIGRARPWCYAGTQEGQLFAWRADE
ncbi:MAG: PQQ-binding-like beta-propeller repeat protein [Planctomycetes bacterium]|nr:PQQ-binding-like beta-propeller repeat protein [Planctomycetota bacterium]